MGSLDLSLTKFTFSTLKRFFPEYDLEWLSSEMEVSLPKELDFVCEGDNARGQRSTSRTCHSCRSSYQMSSGRGSASS